MFIGISNACIFKASMHATLMHQFTHFWRNLFMHFLSKFSCIFLVRGSNAYSKIYLKMLCKIKNIATFVHLFKSLERKKERTKKNKKEPKKITAKGDTSKSISLLFFFLSYKNEYYSILVNFMHQFLHPSEVNFAMKIKKKLLRLISKSSSSSTHTRRRDFKKL